MTQMADKATAAMEMCGLFQTHLNKWNVFTLENQDWVNTKLHSGETYENLLISGPGVNILGKIADAQEPSNNKDDSITQLSDTMSLMQITSNVNTYSVNSGVNTMWQEMEKFWAEVQASRGTHHHDDAVDVTPGPHISTCSTVVPTT